MIGKLKAYDLAKKKRSITQGGIGQDPGMYFSKSTCISSLGSVALLTGDGIESTSNIQGGGTGSLGYTGTSQRIESNIIDEEHMALFSAILSSYQLMATRQMVNPDLLTENHHQINEQDLKKWTYSGRCQWWPSS